MRWVLGVRLVFSVLLVGLEAFVIFVLKIVILQWV